jgi:hypothetical protein
VKACNVNVGAARLKNGAAPLRSDSGNQLLELGTLDDSGLDRRRQLRQLIARNVKVAARMEEASFRKIRRRRIQKIARRSG